MQLLESGKNQRHTELERFGHMKMNGTNQPFILVPQQRIDNALVGGISGHIDVSHVAGMANQVHNEGKSSEALRVSMKKASFVSGRRPHSSRRLFSLKHRIFSNRWEYMRDCLTSANNSSRLKYLFIAQ